MSERIPSIDLKDYVERKYGMTQRYAVPEGMLKAACDGLPLADDSYVKTALEAAIRWLSENPIVPTDGQCDELINLIGATGRSLVRYPSRIDRDQARTILIEWQRQMFLAPEPEPEVCPVEKALRDSGVTIHNDWLCPECEKIHEAIIPLEPSVPEKISMKELEEICGEAKLSNLAQMEYYKRGGEVIHEEIPNIVWIIASSTSSMKFTETTIRALLEIYRRGQKAK